MSDQVQAAQATAEGMQCPICRVALVMTERQGVEIDYCPRCRGVWLDRGELDKIIERSAMQPDASAPPAASFLPQPSPTPAQTPGGFLPQPGSGVYPPHYPAGQYAADPRYRDSCDSREGDRRRGSFLSRLFD
ncbi:zf-TFIIB domain-containing protein [Bosea sp. AS-1]|nr:zf-TFIIB domain-containing protein [Bosea sp. AS-1]